MKTPVPARYADLSTCDEFDLFVFSLRGDLALIDEQLERLDAIAGMEAAQLRAVGETLQQHIDARAKLLSLREAMYHFVYELEKYEARAHH